MAKEDITISTVPVSIRVVEVGNKKMTISVFNQIPVNGFLYSEQKNGFIGWISYKGTKYILYILDSILLKDKVHSIKQELVFDYLPVMRDRNSNRYNEDGEWEEDQIIEKYNKAKKDFENRYNDVLKNENQIYIAV
ncbi:MAG: hypothetical protein Q8K92_06130 [Leadbetterella sp.]|nr:hypothetical protein [Leadbetterella sp.]